MLDYRIHALNEDYHTYRHTEVHDDVLSWLATIPLSRPVWDIGEDFADGILTGDIIEHFFPDIIDLNAIHVPRNMAQRTANWHYLMSNVLPKLDLYVPQMMMVDITNGVHRAAELFLLQLREAVEQYTASMHQTSNINLQAEYPYNIGYNRSSRNQAKARHGGTTLPSITGATTPGGTSSNTSGIKGTNKSGIKGANRFGAKGTNRSGGKGSKQSSVSGANSQAGAGSKRNSDNLDPKFAPCRDALRLKDQEISELQEKVKNYEKLLREKMKLYEKLLQTKDSRIQELETRLGLAKSKRP